MAESPSIPEQTPEPSPLRELLANAGPTVAAMTSYTVMQFVDKWMVSKIGPDPIYVGAQGNGGLASWVPMSIVMGLLTIVNTYVAQNLGAGKPERGAAYVWNGLWICFAAAVALVPYGILLPELFRALGHDERRVALECAYAQPLIYFAFFSMATRAVSQYFYGLHKPGVVLAAGLVGNLTNFALNYCLIYGNFGFPKLGIAGAAYATVIGTLVELAIPTFMFLGPMHRAHGTRGQWRLSLAHVKDILRLGWPGGAMFGNEMICWSIFMVGLVGWFGPLHSTAGWIAHQYMSLSFMPAVGISVAVTAMVGKCMGMGRPDLAAKRANLGVALAAAYMSTCGIIFVVFRHQLVEVFIPEGVSAEDRAFLIAQGSMFLIAAAAFQFFDGVAMTLSGALRGAGDTAWLGVVTVGLAWTLIVGGGLAMVTFVPSLSSLGPWMAAAAYIICLGTVTGLRYHGGKWKSIKLVDRPGV